MPSSSMPSPMRLETRMRRVRLAETNLTSGCRRSQRPAGSVARPAAAAPLARRWAPPLIPSQMPTAARDRSNSSAIPPPSGASSFLEAVADAVERLDHVEVVVDLLELLAQPLDVAVDGAVIDVHLVIIRGIHERVPRLDDAGARRERLQDEELGDGERYRALVPVAGMPFRIELELAALQHARRFQGCRLRVLGAEAAQHGLDPLHDEALRERLGDVVVRAHLKPEQL